MLYYSIKSEGNEVMSELKHVISFSGGKDSTALLLKMIELNKQIDEVVFIDSTVEFPEIYDHISKVEKFINIPIKKLSPKHSFIYYLGTHVKKSGQIGYGFPDFNNRWCTELLKRQPIKTYFRLKNYTNVIEYHGIAYDERERTLKNKSDNRVIKYPLVDLKMTEADCLKYCYDKGLDFNGLYEKFDRISCWCCPMKKIKELYVLYTQYPELWEKLKEMQSLSFRRFRMDYSIEELEVKFNSEKYKQMMCF